MNEYQLEAADQAKGYVESRRSAENTRKYATACREVGEEMDVAVLDLWAVIMAKTGWREGDVLVGSKEGARSEVLEGLLADGEDFLLFEVMFGGG